MVYQIIEAHLIMSSEAENGTCIPSRAEGVGAEVRYVRGAVAGSAE